MKNLKENIKQKKEKLFAVCLSGGGIKGFASLGALTYFQRIFDILSVENFVGTSIGAIICLLLCCGYHPFEIFEEIMKADGLAKPLSKLSFFVEYGLNSSEPLEILISKMVEKKFGKILTLSELREATGKNLVVVAANLSEMKIEYINYENNPNIPCVEAVLLSCNAPGVFKKRIYNGCVYTDGGIFDNYPLDYFDDGEKKILGIDIGKSDFPGEVRNFFDYMHRIMTFAPVQNSGRKSLKGKESLDVRLSIDEFTFNLSPSHDRKIELYGLGHLQASKFYMSEAT